MFYLSPTLTLLMLAIVPPVSLGAVRHLLMAIAQLFNYFTGILWSLPQETIKQDARGYG